MPDAASRPMAGLITAAANAAIAAAYAPEHARLVHTRDLLALQRGILRATVQRNADCEYGRAHRFATIRSVRDFRDAVPLPPGTTTPAPPTGSPAVSGEC